MNEDFVIFYTSKDNRMYKMLELSCEMKQASFEVEETWYCGLNYMASIEGITHFLKDKFDNDNNFDYESFIQDVQRLETLKQTINDTIVNNPREFNIVESVYKSVYLNRVDYEVEGFVNKYGLTYYRY